MASPFFHPQSLKRSEDPDTPRVKKRAKYTQVAWYFPPVDLGTLLIHLATNVKGAN